MIRLKKGLPPAELTSVKAAELTAAYKADKSADVWNATYIRAALLSLSAHKCAYCETLIDEESKYMEVDHFHCKANYEDLVVVWENLLPACKRCNVRKGTHDVGAEGTIINPFVDNPQQHLCLKLYRLKGRTDAGACSVETLYLNQTDRLVKKRFDVGCVISESLERLRVTLSDYIDNSALQTVRRRNRITRGVESLLAEAGSNKEFSATVATVLTKDEDYLWIKQQLQSLQLWTSDLQALHAYAEGIAL